jgi:Schlafen group 3, DNA/RNA helicase domain
VAIAGWAGSVEEFLGAIEADVLVDLGSHLERSLGMPPSRTQESVWREELQILRSALGQCANENGDATSWSIVLEYELPLEGGRRPDAIVLTGSSLAVLEFKQASIPTPAAIDQTEAYARDLSDYHAETHGRHVLPVLVLTQTEGISFDSDPVVISGREEVSHYLLENATEGTIDLPAWISAPYEPLPTLVAAARRIFQHKPLPHVRQALSEDIPGTLRYIGELIAEADATHGRKLILITGVPGSGKTLVGLRLVYERSETEGRGLLLSGNGPLVEVLQHALESRVFVRDLHAFIKTYGVNQGTPTEKVIVFDEAQRAWDEGYMRFKRGVDRSEPELLIEIGARIPAWSVMIGLVGGGQEIFSGEEGGIREWRDAIIKINSMDWTVHVPSALSTEFADCHAETDERLALRVSLRARRAQFVHDWVAHTLTGSLALAARLASKLTTEQSAFPLYLTRDLEQAKTYARARYSEEPEKRYGLLAKAYAKTPRRYGVDNHFQAQRKVKLGPWFNAEANDPLSCCQLRIPLTEFQVQGLEIDLPIVCWGENFLWTGTEWKARPARARYPQEDPTQLLINGYRVLLTRGRDGLLIWLPPETEFDLTEHALLAAGVKPLAEAEDELRDLAVKSS